MRCRAHVPFGLHSIHTHAVDNTCVASYTHTLFDMWLCPICLCSVTALLHRAITCSYSSLPKVAAVPGSQVSVVPLHAVGSKGGCSGQDLGQRCR